MSIGKDWPWKLREAFDQIKNRYDHIGRKTGAALLAIVYPPEVEQAVLKEWHTLSGSFGNGFEVRTIDVLTETMKVVEELGSDSIVGAMSDPLPGAEPETDLGRMWISQIIEQVREEANRPANGKVVIVLENLAALYPVTGPQALMHELWENEQNHLQGQLVVALIPGSLVEPKVYRFVNQREEFMYRGDCL
ncbi:MAG: hypothetical protein WCS37_12130 [Chloroflexota bacterium]|nr:hypothetical protein [Chloroflexota bacterium]